MNQIRQNSSYWTATNHILTLAESLEFEDSEFPAFLTKNSLAPPCSIPLLKLLSLRTRSFSHFSLNMFFLVVSRNESWRYLLYHFLDLLTKPDILCGFLIWLGQRLPHQVGHLLFVSLFDLVNDHHHWLDLIYSILSLTDSRRSDMPFVLSAIMPSKTFLTSIVQ